MKAGGLSMYNFTHTHWCSAFVPFQKLTKFNFPALWVHVFLMRYVICILSDSVPPMPMCVSGFLLRMASPQHRLVTYSTARTSRHHEWSFSELTIKKGGAKIFFTFSDAWRQFILACEHFIITKGWQLKWHCSKKTHLTGIHCCVSKKRKQLKWSSPYDPQETCSCLHSNGFPWDIWPSNLQQDG